MPDTAEGNTVRIEVGDVDTGDTVNIVLNFRVPSDATAGKQFRNDADITGTFEGEEVAKRVSVLGPTVVQPQLPRTGMETGAAALGLLLLGGGAMVVRRRLGQQV